MAAAVSDGTRVDWNREMAETPGLTRELEGLRAMAAIQELSASTTETLREGRETPAPPPTARPKLLFTWGPLEVMERLGGGSFGDVYRAFDPALQRDVALKLHKADRPEDEIRTFLSEARRLARLNHPNVVTVHGVGEHDGRAGMWTELVKGQDLESYLSVHGQLGAREAAGVGIQVCHALAAVHQAGVIHRDVKTGNIMRDAHGRIVLMDFGSGGDLPAMGSVHETYNIKGTPTFMAPEHLRGIVVGPATDIYGLGVVLYRLVTRAFPIAATTLPELLERHERGPVPLRDLRPDLPTEFVRLVHKAIARLPQERYVTAGEMELALVSALETSTLPGVPASNASGVRASRASDPVSGGTSGTRPNRPPRWKRWEFLAAGSLGAAYVVLAIQLHWFPFGRQDGGQGVPTPPVRSTADLTASASLFRSTPAGNQLLPPGTTLHQGDKLFMEVTGSAPMYVYVLNEDDSGRVFILFPLHGLDLSNPLAAGRRHRLPGRLNGTHQNWGASQAGGRERILTIASRDPVPEMEGAIREFPAARPGQPLRVSPEVVHRLRGIGSLVPEPDSGPSRDASRLADVLARTLGAVDSGNNRIWFQKVELLSP